MAAETRWSDAKEPNLVGYRRDRTVLKESGLSRRKKNPIKFPIGLEVWGRSKHLPLG
jgi:hypothetical protein